MGYKIKDTREEQEKQIMEELSKYGIEINIPKEEDKCEEKDK